MAAKRSGYLPPPWPADLFWRAAARQAEIAAGPDSTIKERAAFLSECMMSVLENHDVVGNA